MEIPSLDIAAIARRHGATPGPNGHHRTQKDGEELLSLIRQRLDDSKAEDVVTVDLHGKSSMCDYMVIATGQSQRQVASMADNIAELVRSVSVRKPSVEGMPHGDWVLIDGGDVIVHLFRHEVRQFYNLEKMWGIELPERVEGIGPRPVLSFNGPADA